MAVSPQNAADVRTAHEEAAKSATERADLARNPLLAMLGVGEAAVTAFAKALADANKAMADARARAKARESEKKAARRTGKQVEKQAKRGALDVRGLAAKAQRKADKVTRRLAGRPNDQRLNGADS